MFVRNFHNPSMFRCAACTFIFFPLITPSVLLSRTGRGVMELSPTDLMGT